MKVTYLFCRHKAVVYFFETSSSSPRFVTSNIFNQQIAVDSLIIYYFNVQKYAEPIGVQEAFRDKPANLRCPSCGKNISTQLEYHNGLLTYASCVCIFLFGGACGCCLIPFCVKACKDVDHKCPSCQRYIGSFRRLGD
ncbi:hypothetical protein MN116_001952 [Schistosoma mekongi]|uniref:LITAF domain-containing protein n=1 Tax=Schistosoma mekongi TaxID=38744 RepID=A0AAE2D8C0_SCHME|nr:hypothetical protein MN116_001952 [Schistosoma mekongi]